MIGTDIRTLSTSSTTYQILTAPEVIAINQDSLGVQGSKRVSSNGLEVWSGPLSDGSIAVVLLNRSDKPELLTARWYDIGLNKGTKATVRDVWNRKDLAGSYIDSFTTQLNVNQSSIYRVIPLA